MSKHSRDDSSGRKLSAVLATLCSAYANRLVLLNALDSRGALWRALRIPAPRALARFFRWWSRGWLGQVLGFGWSKAIFLLGLHNQLDPKEIGDQWKAYRNGNVKGR